ncbi:Cytidylate kinase [Kordia antarctica]|uniref:Cytidylate kinase n=1 Tax=Kordia antarctica TaxID=1218801 RepID=A0A7L4ZIQ1_9FLAO|nr:AAA family ATPase [Kordia antarctica]QHI36066.1 Cytidylate kinase [Kordia antarctica]
MKILIIGASGSGTTTLGKALSVATNFKHLDVDDYYWKVTNPPFQEKISLAERTKNLTIDFHNHTNVIVSGSLVSWGKAWKTAFDLAIFVTLDKNIRMQRLEQREFERYGDKLVTDLKVKETSEAFLAWAKRYDDSTFTGRSMKIHLDWLALLSCKTLTIDSALSLENNVSTVLRKI